MRGWLDRRWAAATALWARVGPRTHDVAFVAIGIGLLIANEVLMPDQINGVVTNPVVIAVLAAVASVSLWWRRGRPVLVTAIGILVGTLTSIYAYALIGLFTLAIRRRDRLLVVLAVLGFVGAVVGNTDLDRFAPAPVFGTLVVFLIAVLAGAYLGVRRDLLASLRAQVAQAEAERDLRTMQARIGERSRIAREMHDVLAHKVSLIALQAGGLEVGSGADPREIERSAHLIGVTARQALADLRDVLGVLRADESSEGSDLDPQPSLADVPALVESSVKAGVRVELSVREGLGEPEVPGVPEVIGRTAYRVVQEALTNVHKHARGASTQVRIDGEEGASIVVEVRNARSVCGDRLLPGAGAGLTGLRERVELLHGEFVSGATPSGGWLVRASIPWPRSPSSVGARAAS